MSDQRPDDETLGRALGRAVETQSVRETPFERSRVSVQLARPARRSLLGPLLAGAAAILLGLAVGSVLFDQRGDQPGPVASDPSATPAATFDPAAPSPSATFRGPTETLRVFFARDDLPPVGSAVRIEVNEGPTAVGYTRARLRALATAAPTSGLVNLLASSRTKPVVGEVRIDGDLVRVDYAVPGGDWGVSGSAASRALLQQLVYTATEQAGLRRALITQNGGSATTIDQLVVDKPLSREDVVGYREPGSTDPIRGFGERGGSERRAATKHAVEAVPGLTRFEIEIAPLPGQPSRAYPDWNVSVARSDETLKPNGGKWRLTVQVDNASDPTTGFVVVDRTPLRSITTATGKGPGNTLIYELALDDLRPWRTALSFDPLRIIVEIGGDPAAISGRNSVNSPRPGEPIGRDFTVAGIASAFEANVQYRVRDTQGRVVASGFTTATNCCEAGGLFSAAVRVPPEVPAGRVTLEVFQGSPRDGSDLALISIPLQLR